MLPTDRHPTVRSALKPPEAQFTDKGTSLEPVPVRVHRQEKLQIPGGLRGLVGTFENPRGAPIDLVVWVAQIIKAIGVWRAKNIEFHRLTCASNQYMSHPEFWTRHCNHSIRFEDHFYLTGIKLDGMQRTINELELRLPKREAACALDVPT
jgi:hypothetical protein